MFVCRSNFLGTSFTTYGSGSRPHSSNNRRSNKQREEFVAVQYVSKEINTSTFTVHEWTFPIAYIIILIIMKYVCM